MTNNKKSIAPTPSNDPPLQLLREDQVLVAAAHILAQHGNRLEMYPLYEAICDTYHVQFTNPEKKDYGAMLARIHTILCVNDRHFAWDHKLREWVYGPFGSTAKSIAAVNPVDGVLDSSVEVAVR